MKQNVSLYIDGVLADCDPSTLVQMTYTREELSSPSVVKNSYSQSVSLPATPANDAIFSHFARNDFRTATGFSPLSRLPFLLQSDSGEVVERGYLKLNSVAFTGAFAHSYTCTLYGGLGGFLYGLTYNEDGSKKTLADFILTDGDDGTINPKTKLWGLNAQDVSGAWYDIREGVNTHYGQIINYAPCYNGLPACAFDANKAVYKEGASVYYRVPNLYTSKDGYSPAADAEGYVLVEMENEHTEWEMQELRGYLQRPVIRLRYLLESFELSENSGGYTFRLNTAQLFNEDNPYFANGWITLPLFDRDHLDPFQFYLSDLFRGTATPADYLLGIAKIFGCVFRYDAPSNTITLCTRDAFYTTGLPVIDLTARIDRSRSREVTPLTFAHRYYDYSVQMGGDFAKRYEDKFGRVYGSQRIDTGYGFDTETEEVFKGASVKGCADALESNRNYCVYGGDADVEYGTTINYLLKFAFHENVSWRLYKTTGSETTELECHPTTEYPIRRFLYGDDYSDFMNKPQLHDADGKGTDGAGILLLYDGSVETPSDIQGGFVIDDVIFRLTDDNDAMLALNAGKPCWNITPADGASVGSLPSFRRWLNDGPGGDVAYMADFGKSREYITGDVPDGDSVTLYDAYWKAYTEDRYNVDSRVLKCYCDLRGLGRVEDLLRRFFWYEGAVWSLNKITNHSLTTLDPTECEFVRVQDTENYNNGQLID